MNNHIITLAVMAVVIVWVVYRRVQRSIGFQRFVKRRIYARIAIIAVIGALMLASGVVHPIAYVGDAAGLLVGTALALVAVRYLVFEKRESDWYYRTHVWIESVVLVLFLARLVLRVWEVMQNGGRQNAAQAEDPVTAGAIFMFVGYYIAFAIGLLRKERALEPPDGD